MTNLRNIVSSFLGLGSLLAAALPVESIPAAGCTATSYSEIASIVASCPTSIIQGVTVPAGGQIVLQGLHGKTVCFPLLHLFADLALRRVA
jgi:hypothetical protein